MNAKIKSRPGRQCGIEAKNQGKVND